MDGNISLLILIIVTRRKKISYYILLPMILTKEEIYPEREKTMTKLLGVENKT